MPYDKSPMKKSSCIKMYDGKGKQTGLMMEGSVAHMESALYHSGKSKMHAKPGKDYPDDGHLHYQNGKKVESPGVSETNKLSDTSGAVSQMSPYKFTGMSGGSAMHQEDPNQKNKKKKLTEAEYVDRELTKRMKKKKMTPEEVLAETKSIKGLYKQLNLGNN